MDQDIQHIRLLSIFHYVAAAITALFGCVPVVYLGMGIAMLNDAFDEWPEREADQNAAQDNQDDQGADDRRADEDAIGRDKRV